MKVKAGERLLMIDDRVGELYLRPIYPHICDRYMSTLSMDIFPTMENLIGGMLVLLWRMKGVGKMKKNPMRKT